MTKYNQYPEFIFQSRFRKWLNAVISLFSINKYEMSQELDMDIEVLQAYLIDDKLLTVDDAVKLSNYFAKYGNKYGLKMFSNVNAELLIAMQQTAQLIEIAKPTKQKITQSCVFYVDGAMQ